MHITLPQNTQRQLQEAAQYCSLPPERLAQLFVEDGLELYRREPNELRENLNGETE